MGKFIAIVLAACLTFVSHAEAKPVKGRLSGRNIAGLKVLSITQSGRAATFKVSSSGLFSASLAKGSTLHLVDKDGKYAGPVVYPRGRKALSKLNGKGGSIGTVKVQRGFAVATGKSSALFTGTSLIPYTPGRGPRGAGKLGLVRVSARAALYSRAGSDSQPGADLDKDGLPNTIDADAGGDGKLDATGGDSLPPPEIKVRSASTLRGTLVTGLNAHLSQVTAEQIDGALKSGLILGFEVRRNSENAPMPTAVNVDCLGLPYCTAPGATATLRTEALRQQEGAPWLSYDPDGDGYPNLAPFPAPATPFYVGIRPSVTRQELNPGDTILFKMTTETGDISMPVVLPFFFVTVPALKSYGSGETTTEISYPVAPGSPGSAMDAPFPMSDSSVQLTFWKPQRVPIEGAESGGLVDIGKLSYKLSLFAMGSTQVMFCQPGDFSAHSATLSPQSTPLGYAFFSDSAEDVPYENGETLSLTFNARACLERYGFGASGQRFGIDLNADSQASDQTSQTFYFQLP